MDLWHLTVFCEVVKQESFSKAGRSIRLSQPTVSSHVKDLENHFGFRLIDRLRQRVEPTPAGRLLYQYAQRLLTLRDETVSAMAAFQGRLEGHLKVGGSTIPGAYLLPRAIGKFVNDHPHITLSLEIADTQKTIAAVAAGDLEMAVVGARSGNASLTQKALVSDVMRLIVPKGHKWDGRKQLHAQDLSTASFVIREPGSGTLKSVAQCMAEAGIDIDSLHVVAQMGSTEAIKQAIKGGVGVSILSTVAVADEIENGQLYALSISGVELERHFYLTTHRLRTSSPVAEAFMAFLGSYFGIEEIE